MLYIILYASKCLVHTLQYSAGMLCRCCFCSFIVRCFNGVCCFRRMLVPAVEMRQRAVDVKLLLRISRQVSLVLFTSHYKSPLVFTSTLIFTKMLSDVKFLSVAYITFVIRPAYRYMRCYMRCNVFFY